VDFFSLTRNLMLLIVHFCCPTFSDRG